MEKFKGNGFEISRVGLGCMRMSAPLPSNRQQSIATIHGALDAGINLLNIGDFYGFFGHNEKLISEALQGYDREKAFISLKYGRFNPLFFKMDVGPKHIKENIKKSLFNLKLDYVDLYQPARIDMGIPFEETIYPIKELIKEGCIKHLGVSEVDEDTLRKIHKIHPVALVESEVSITNNEIDDTIIPTAEELGIGIVGFGILAFGKLFKKSNDPLVKIINAIAAKRDVSISQIAHAWVLRKSDNMIPLIGSRKIERLKDTMKCLDIHFTNEEQESIKIAMLDSDIMGRNAPKLTVTNGRMKMQR